MDISEKNKKDVLQHVRMLLGEGILIEPSHLWKESYSDEENTFSKVLAQSLNSYQKNQKEVCAELCNEACSIAENSILSYELCLIGEAMLLLMKKFMFAHRMRIRIFEKLLLKYHTEKVEEEHYMAIFWALAEMGEKREIEEHKKNLDTICSGKYRDRIKNFFSFIENIEVNNCFEKTLSDKKFYNMVQDKRVAIVGVCDSALDSEYIQDNFDLIIGVNNMGETLQGIRPNIYYYNKTCGELLENEQYMSPSRDEFRVYKYIRSEKQQMEIKEMKARELIIAKGLMTNGYPNMIQYVLFDILHFSPKYIQVFNTNFYTSKKMYCNEHTENREYSRNKVIDSFAEHNLLDQFIYTKQLLKNKRVIFDKIGKKVLDLSLEEYAEVLSGVFDDKGGVDVRK